MEPLASRIRPDSLAAYVGQDHLVGPGKPLRVAMEKQQLFSFILWGPPGSGKTTLARLYARSVGAQFHEISAVDAGKDDIRRILPQPGELSFGKPVVLFIDEIHRFNKAQQDFLLPYVERGVITLVGATTENPSFEVISPLLSRCRVFVLRSHSAEDIETILARTKVKMPKAARAWLVSLAQGDAREALTILDATQQLYGEVTLETLQETVQTRHITYDKKGDEHYNTVSAFIKSMRAGRTDAALHYLARMVEAGEDPRFIARRMVIFASEDVGLAQPTALVVATAVFDAVSKIGYPEARIILSHGAVYLSRSKKDRRAYDAIQAALSDVQAHGSLPIPLQLRNAPTKLMKEEGYGKGYDMYPPPLRLDEKDTYMPNALQRKRYFLDDDTTSARG